MNEFKKRLEVTTDKKQEEKADVKKGSNEASDRVEVFKELIRKYNEEAWEK